MRFRNNFLLYTLIPLVTLFIGASYIRFMVLHDYTVAYEGMCDPITESCFIGCEDEECTVEYYYTQVEKYAPNLNAQCGNDITDCEDANVCLKEEGSQCSVTYCDPEADGEACETFTEDSELESGIGEEPVLETTELEAVEEAQELDDMNNTDL